MNALRILTEKITQKSLPICNQSVEEHFNVVDNKQLANKVSSNLLAGMASAGWFGEIGSKSLNQTKKWTICYS